MPGGKVCRFRPVVREVVQLPRTFRPLGDELPVAHPDGPIPLVLPEQGVAIEGPTGERFTVYTAKAATETTQMRYTAQDKDGAMFWADRGVGYVVSGTSDRERLTQVARMVYDQAEKNGG